MAASSSPDSKIPAYKHENYYISGGYAYTKDHVMVHKLIVYKIPRKTIDIREYFSQYGNIKNVRFVAAEGRDYPDAAIVHFESPTDAARVLFSYHKSLDGMVTALCHVKVDHSRYQPNFQSAKKILRGKCIFSDENQLLLNDDCLEYIMRLLPLSSQLSFARSSSQTRRVFHSISKILYRKVFLESLVDLSQWDIRTFFHLAGDNIIHIEGKLPIENQQHILKFMNMFCINLEVLDMDSSVPQICRNDPFVQILRKHKKLKTLKLSKYFRLLGKDLYKVSSTMENLSVYCSKIEDEHINSLLRKSMSNLKELHVGSTMYFNNYVGNAMAVSCENLETITIAITDWDYYSGYDPDYGLLAKLPKLKNLTIIFWMRDGYCPSLYDQLIEHKSNFLEVLKIDGLGCVSNNVALQISQLTALRTLHCSFSDKLTDIGLNYWSQLEHLEEIDLRCCMRITETGLLNLVLTCQKLKLVNLQYCFYISTSLIIELIQKMQEQIQNGTFMRTEPVLFKAGCTDIYLDIFDPEYEAISHLVILDLETPKLY